MTTAESAALIAQTSTDTGPGPLQRLGDQEWQILCEKDDRTSPAEHPEMLLITRNELGAAMCEAYILAKDQDRASIEAAESALAVAHAAGTFREGVEAAAKVVSEARMGERDSDLRSIIHGIRALQPPTAGKPT